LVDRHIIIIGGGLAGLSAGCYARRSGFRSTIVEHNLALGGVCTAWQRGPYLVDGCIQWLTGGPFERLYEELEILPSVALRTLETWATYRDTRDRFEVAFTKDLDRLVAQLAQVSTEDAAELARLREGAAEFARMKPPMTPPELVSLRDHLRSFWEMRDALGTLLHFRKPVGLWARDHLTSARLQRIFTHILPETAPAFFLLMVLGYLEQGYLSRPVGGTAAFRDALERTYSGLGGATVLHATVDEVLVRDGRASGVRLADGTMLAGDLVLSTASAPETVLRLLGGRYDADSTRDRLARWKLFDPIVLASFGVAEPYADAPALLILDGIGPFEVGGRSTEHIEVRVCNDDPCFAPLGHTVVQVMLQTDYQWWATRGTRYGAEKDALADATIAQLEPHFPGFRQAVRMIDLATPLTYWNMARSWRGAYEGWMPTAETFFGHVKKKLTGLEGFYMAGQWVEPGGGVPTAVMSGRQAIQLVCESEGCAFVAH
jgi:phytoene dehydrogenase-like protein